MDNLFRQMLRDALLEEHSKRQTMRIVQMVGDNAAAFDELVWLFLHDEYRVVQRAAWPVRYCVEAHPAWAGKHLGDLLKNLRNPVHDAVKRNTARLLEFLPVPEALVGEAVDVLFKLLADPKEPVAVRCFSMTAIFKHCQNEPELLEELRLTVEELLENGSTPGLRSRGSKLLKAINKRKQP